MHMLALALRTFIQVNENLIYRCAAFSEVKNKQKKNKSEFDAKMP